MHKIEGCKQNNRWIDALCKGVETFFADWDQSKCEYWYNMLSAVFSIVWVVVSLVATILGFWWVFGIVIAVLVFHLVPCLSLLHAIRCKEQEKDRLLEQTQQDYQDEINQHNCTKQELTALQQRYHRSTTRYIEIGLFSKKIQAESRQKNAKRVYTQLANSVSKLISAYTSLTRENFSVSVYMFDGENKLIRRVEVDSAVPTTQAPHKGVVNSVDEKKDYYYAKCVQNKRKTFYLSSKEEIEKEFYPSVDIGADYSHLSQYAAMSYDLGFKLKLYVEAIAYDGSRFGDNLEDFISYAIAPFATPIAELNWKMMREG